MTSTVGRLLVAKIGIIKTRFLLRTIGFSRTVKLVTALPQVGSLGGPDPRWVQEIAWASKGPIGGSCLDRSVLLWFYFHEYGLEADLRVGVQRTDNGIDAHAWVEYQGQVLNDDPAFVEQFTAFDEDPVGMVFR